MSPALRLDFDSAAALPPLLLPALPLPAQPAQPAQSAAAHSAQPAPLPLPLLIPRHSSLTYVSDYFAVAAARSTGRGGVSVSGGGSDADSAWRMRAERGRPLIEELHGEQQPTVTGAGRPEWVDGLLSAIAALDTRLTRIESSLAAMERAQQFTRAQQHTISM